MRSVLVFAAIACLAFADVSLNFEAGANLSKADADFSFRYTFADTESFLGSKFLVWSSASVDASGANASAKASADGMVGFGILPLGGQTALVSIPPISLFAYGSGSAAVDVNVDTLAKNVFVSHQSIGAEFSAGVVAVAALYMQEVDSNNKAVGDKIFLRPIGTCNDKKITGEGESLTGLTCTFKAIKYVLSIAKETEAEVTVTYITSKVAGILGYGNTPVSPRSFETVIEVKNFPLSDAKNHVRMDLGFLAVTAGLDASGKASEVIHIEGHDDVYIAASTKAIVGDDKVDVSVQIDTNGDASVGDVIEAGLEAALGASFDTKIAHVDFPAGAKNFIYDPALGAGVNIYQAAGDSAATAALSLLVLLISVLVYLF